MPVKAPYTEKVRGGRRPVTYRDSHGNTSSALVVGRGSNAPQQQTITIPNTVTAGTWTITINGQTTGLLNWNATASQVQSAINALSNMTTIPVTVTGGPGGTNPFVVTMSPNSNGLAVATVDSSGLTGGVGTVAITRANSTTLLRLQLETHYTATDSIKDNVNLATGLKQTGVYFNR